MSVGQSQIPAIRTFQLDAAALGKLSSSVNLFRGDVNLRHSLVELPGRPGKGALAVEVSILYQSNVHRSAELWNIRAPTGILGLGWSLPLDHIVMEDDDSPSRMTRTYRHVSAGVSNLLVREPAQPFRFAMPADLQSALEDGQAVGDEIQAQFTRRGVPITATAEVTRLDAGRWSIRDGELEQLFVVELADDELKVSDGGEAYQLHSYEPWKILYYPDFERWLIVKESGITYSYGGKVAAVGGPSDAPAHQQSAGNSIEWAVRWSSPHNSRADLWAGASALSEAGVQRQTARCWHLEQVTDPWGDSIRYAYNEWPRDADGLIPGVEQRVGSATGLPFTKACYLTSITDVFGRKVVLRYGNKLFNDPDSAPLEPREFLDPHKNLRAAPQPDQPPVNLGVPNAYQDRYETRYLDRLVVESAAGVPLLSFVFDYRVAHVGAAQSPSALVGDTSKRFLLSVTQLNIDGEAQPGLELDYFWQTEDLNAGALRAITYPEGGRAAYSYTRQSLAICQRRQAVNPPTEVLGRPQPKVWFGADYAVSVWYNNTDGKLSLQIFTWLGHWACWDLDDPETGSLIFSGKAGIDLKSLEVLTRDEFIALYFERDAGTRTDVYVFRRDPARPGHWLAYQDASGSTACNRPSIRFSNTSTPVEIHAGDSFLVALQKQRDAQNSYSLTRYTFHWTSRQWIVEAIEPPSGPWERVYLVTAQEYVFTLWYAQSGALITLMYLDPQGNWHPGDSKHLPHFDIPLPDPVAVDDVGKVPGFVMSPGASLVATSRLQSRNWRALVRYDVDVFQWDENYQLIDDLLAPQTFEDRVASDEQFAALPHVPRVFANSLVACAGNLLRFNGRRWHRDSALASTPDLLRGREQRFAYDPDYALQVIYSSGLPTARFLPFEADDDRFSPTLLPPEPPLKPGHYRQQALWPTAGGDYVTIGQRLYFRADRERWGPNLASPIYTLAEESKLDTEAVINQAPGFLAYDRGTGSKTRAEAVLLENGSVLTPPQELCLRKSPAEACREAEKYATRDESGIVSGLEPSGPGSLVTYPAGDNSFSEAQRIFLYRYAAESLTEPVVHHAVTRLALDDGFGQLHQTFYDYAADSAACDPSGEVVKYYRSTSYPGATDAADSREGHIVNLYVNGLSPQPEQVASDASKVDGYDMLDGYLQSRQFYDRKNRLVASVSKRWQVFTQRSARPLSAGASPAPVPLHGGFVRLVGQTDVRDGVTSSASTSYHPPGTEGPPFSGLPMVLTAHGRGPDGEAETRTRTLTYGYQTGGALGESLIALHMLMPRAQTVVQRANSGGPPIVARAAATTFLGWSATRNGIRIQVPAAEAAFAFLGPGGSAAFPFHSYQPGRVPEGWLRRSAVVHRTSSGLVAEAVDAALSVKAVLFDRHQQFPVARFTGASLAAAECTYLGFETYEDDSSWDLAGGAEADETDAHTGSASLRLPPGGSLRTVLEPQGIRQVYLLGFWYKTGRDFQPASGSGWTISASFGAQPASFPFADTQGRWRYASLGFSLPAATEKVFLTLTANNTSAQTVWLDDLHVGPLVGRFTARAYDPDFGFPTASVHADGQTARLQRDRRQRPAVDVGPGEQVKTVLLQHLSRQGNPAGLFAAADPNAALIVHPALGGSCETFRCGDEWQQRWQASGAPGDWQRVDGALRHASTTSDTLTYRGEPSPEMTTRAVYFEVTPRLGEPDDPVALRFGNTVSIRWNPQQSPAGWQLLSGDRPIAEPISRPPRMARAWLAILGQDILLFFGDGQLLFSQPMTLPAEPPAIVTGRNRLDLRNVTVVENPRVRIHFLDASGKRRQEQALDGRDAVVQQTVYDAVGRPAVETKRAPASFGSGAGKPVLQYRDGFVDVDDFLTGLDDSGVMQGDVADYYRGQTEGGTARSDDEGYPYHRWRFEASPLSRVIEEGLPGKTYAIRNLQHTTAAQRKTFQHTYGATSAGLYLETRISPLKNRSTRQLDTFQRIAGQSVFAATAETAANRTEVRRTYSADGLTVELQLPNFFDPGRSDNASFIATHLYDRLGRLVSRTDPDSGTLRTMYDSVGRPRFVRPNQSSATPAYLIYTKYDAIGREVELGTCQFDWNSDTEALLQQAADDPTWPSSSSTPPVPFTPVRSVEHDGDGSDPRLIGRVCRVETVNRRNVDGVDLTLEVSEAYGYTVDGQVASVRLAAGENGRDLGTHEAGYTYNNAAEVTRISYPDGSLAEVAYAYDDRGRIRDIRWASGEAPVLAAYTYNADGDIASESLAGGTWLNRFEYESTGWLQRITTDLQQQPAAIRQDYRYNVDGSIWQIDDHFEFPGDGSFDNSTTYAYDVLNRLRRSQATLDSSLDVSLGGYDANGNIEAVTQGDSTLSFAYRAGSDQVDAVSGERAGPGRPFAYDSTGRTIAAPDLEASPAVRRLSYDPSLARTASVGVDGDAGTTFAYGARGQRVVKRVVKPGAAASYRLYVSGINPRPLFETEDGTKTSYIYGPTGLIAFQQESLYFPIKDLEQTVRAVVDAKGALVARYVYLPFGTIASISGTDPRVLRYLYMGQEFDPETGLYNFRARLYDPVLRRFYSPDPARQFASPYVFVGDSPTLHVDPSGDFSWLAQVGIGAGLFAVTAAGIGLTLFTGGASDAAAADIDATVVAADVAAESAEVADAAAEGGEAAEASSDAASAANRLATRALRSSARILYRAQIGGGLRGIQYDATTRRQDFQASHLFEQIGVGAAAGAVSGATSEAASLFADGLGAGPVASAVTRIAASTIGSSASFGTSQMLDNRIQDRTWDRDLPRQLVIGAAVGLVSGTLTTGVRNRFLNPAIKTTVLWQPWRWVRSLYVLRRHAALHAYDRQLLADPRQPRAQGYPDAGG